VNALTMRIAGGPLVQQPVVALLWQPAIHDSNRTGTALTGSRTGNSG
jgi:hypothetical protein